MIDVVMPKMGESITEGTVLEWKKSIGEKIGKDETLLEISTDKVDSEVPSPAEGTLLEIIAKVNDTVPVGQVIARIGDSSEKEDSIVTSSKEDNKENENLEPIPTPNQHEPVKSSPILKVRDGKYFYSPLVKSIALKEGLGLDELGSIAGSGLGGRVNKKDILNYLSSRNDLQQISQTAELSLKQNSEPAQKQVVDKAPMADKVEPIPRMRKKIAEHMRKSLQTSPHVYTAVEADVTNLVEIRNTFKESFKSRSSVSLTYTPMLLDACIQAIQEFPLINASMDEENIIHHQHINMGVAVALPDDNLIVPVIHSSEEKNFLGLARSVSDLANRARDNNLNPDDIFGSTFTLTNPGVFGGLFGMGIINQPNVGILSIGSFQKRPVVKETSYGDTIVVRTMVYLTLSYDHRIIDGAYGTKFLSRLVEIIENYDRSRVQN